MSDRQIGPRSSVWSEKEMVDLAAFEFTEVNVLGHYLKSDLLFLGKFKDSIYSVDFQKNLKA